MEIDKKKLSEAVAMVKDFAYKVPGGESYWIDPSGKRHSADMGYVIEFLEDLSEYLSEN